MRMRDWTDWIRKGEVASFNGTSYMRLKSNPNAATAATKVAGLEKEGRAPMCDALLEHPSLFPPPHLSLKKCIETPFATYSGRMHAMLQKRRAAYFLSIHSAQRRRVRAATRWAFECALGFPEPASFVGF